MNAWLACFWSNERSLCPSQVIRDSIESAHPRLTNKLLAGHHVWDQNWETEDYGIPLRFYNPEVLRGPACVTHRRHIIMESS